MKLRQFVAPLAVTLALGALGCTTTVIVVANDGGAASADSGTGEEGPDMRSAPADADLSVPPDLTPPPDLTAPIPPPDLAPPPDLTAPIPPNDLAPPPDLRPATPSCSDGIQNGEESDIDCGGTGGCDRCPTQKHCGGTSDCASDICVAHVCAAKPLFEAIGPYRTPLGYDTLISADLNGDGKLDLAGTSADGSAVALWAGQGAGNFAAAVEVPAGLGLLRSVTAADFDGDGRLDLAVCGASAATSVLLNDSTPGGTPTFKPAIATTIRAQPLAVAAATLDGDTKVDLLVAHGTGGVISNLRGLGTGSFTVLPALTWFSPRVVGVTTGDFNGDGKLDFAAIEEATSTAGEVIIGIGKGDGSFSDLGGRFISAKPAAVATGDLDRDGKLDVVTVESGAEEGVTVLLGNGTGTLQVPRHTYLSDGPRRLVLGDFNGDGKLDVVVATLAGAEILYGDGAGGLVSARLVQTSSLTYSVASGDFNQDGKPDLALASSTADKELLILLNTTPSAP